MNYNKLFWKLQIQWFWRALRSFDQADRAKFLQFVTGTSKVPLQGFAALEGMNGVQKFQIHRDDRSTDRLPSAHTWYVFYFYKSFFFSHIHSNIFALIFLEFSLQLQSVGSSSVRNLRQVTFLPAEGNS